MHYKDGTAAKVGDLVKGTAYNTKNPDGSPRVLYAQMLKTTPGSETCNYVVAFVVVPLKPEEERFIRDNSLSYAFPLVCTQDGAQRLVAKSDYSECKAFELVHRPG
jgi:hypothetical protein